MVKRPGFTEDTFLRHIFAPKKNPMPTGIRKATLAFTKGRAKARVASFNRMSTRNQQLLKASGQREAYLRGEATLKDARSVLRETAVSKGIAKPLRTRVREAVRPSNTQLDDFVASHVIKELRDAGKGVDAGRVRYHVPYMDTEDKIQATRWNVGQIKAYASDRSKLITIDEQEVNPLWYHYSNQ